VPADLSTGRSGLDRTHAYRLESGRQSVTKIVADALGVKVRELVKAV
jgi:hypothetical protein